MSSPLRLPAPPSQSTEWISAEEVMRRARWTRAIFLARQAELVSRPCAPRSGNDRELREYLAPSIPPACLSLVSATPLSDIAPLFASAPEALDRAALPDTRCQAEADARYAILAPVFDFQRSPERFAHLRLKDGTPVTSLQRMLRFVAETSGKSLASIKRWVSAYRRGGYAALADRVRSDKGKSRWFDRHPDAALLAAYLYLNERQSVSFVVRQIAEMAQTLGLSGEELPSGETVRVFLGNEISPALRTLARKGEVVYRTRMAPYLRRAYVDVYANQVWVADHMIHDIEAANDLFEDAEWGAPVRMRLSAMIDYRSRLAVGVSWAWEGSSRSIAATLRRAVLAYGPPEMLYMDNGKDYLKVARGAAKGHELSWLRESPLAPPAWWQKELEWIERTGVLARLGVAAQHCLPHHPQSKHVERWFRTVHMQFDARHQTYTGGSPATRPESTEVAMMQHRRLLKKGRVEESAHPLASSIVLAFLSWLDTYNHAPHEGEGMERRSPAEVFRAALNPNQVPAPEPAELTLLLADMTRRMVDSCAIRLGNRRYTPRPEDRQAWAAMHEMNEREVLVAYDKGDPETAVVLDADGRALAFLVPEQLVRFAPGDEATNAAIAASFQTRRGLEKAARSTLRLIADGARAAGARSAQETLYDRVGVPDASLGPVITQRKPRLRPGASKDAVAPTTAADIARDFLEAANED